MACVMQVAGDITYTPPSPNARGGITGVVPTDQQLQAVIAVEPYELKLYRAQIDKTTGRFIFAGLEPGEYDLLIKTVGRVYEGITLDMQAEAPPIVKKDLQKLCDEAAPFVFKTEDYFNKKHIVRFASDGQTARLFMVQTRTKQVVDPGGAKIKAHIRRFDYVDLIKTRKVWQVRKSRHMLRQEVPYKSRDVSIELTYSPNLGGILVGDRVKDLGTIALHKLPKAPRGKYAGAKAKASTR